MYYGKPGDWFENDYVAGFVNEDGTLNVCYEKNLTDKDLDRYAVEVQNGDGFYNSEGKYVAFSHSIFDD